MNFILQGSLFINGSYACKFQFLLQLSYGISLSANFLCFYIIPRLVLAFVFHIARVDFGKGHMAQNILRDAWYLDT